MLLSNFFDTCCSSPPAHSSQSPASARLVPTLSVMNFYSLLLFSNHCVVCAVPTGCLWEFLDGCLLGACGNAIENELVILVSRTTQAWREGEVVSTSPLSTSLFGSSGPCTEPLGEDISTTGQIGACGCVQFSESDIYCHFFGWVLIYLGVEFGMSSVIEIDLCFPHDYI